MIRIFRLTEALAALQSAQADVDASLAAAAKNATFVKLVSEYNGAYDFIDADDGVDDDTEAAAIAAEVARLKANPATDADVTKAGGVATANLVDFLPVAVADFNKASSAAKEALISDALAQAAKTVTDQQADVVTAEAKLKVGVKTNVANANAKLANFEVAQDKATDAQAVFTEELEVFALLNGIDTPSDLSISADGKQLLLEETAIAQLKNGKWALVEADTTVTPAVEAAFTVINTYNSDSALADNDAIRVLDTLFSTVNAQISAQSALVTAETAATQAVANLANADAPGTFTADQVKAMTSLTDVSAYLSGNDLVPSAFDTATEAYLQEVTQLAKDKATQAELATAVADYKAIAALVTEYDGLKEDLADAREAIQASEEDGGLGIQIVELDGSDALALAGTEELFVFMGNKEASEILFFEEGDQLYFGDKFTFVKLAEDVDFANTREGDAATLEIFYQVEGNNVVFYVEQEAEAGREKTLDNITTVTLTGVADVAIDGGFVALAA